MKFNLWNCEGKRLPPSFFEVIVWVGFTKMQTPCNVPDSVFGLYLCHFFRSSKNRRKFNPLNLKDFRMPPSKMALKIAPPTIGKRQFPGILDVRSQKNAPKRKKTPSPSAGGVRFRGVFGCRKWVITPRKSVPWCWGNVVFLVARTTSIRQLLCVYIRLPVVPVE